jgi:hypothetical protein
MYFVNLAPRVVYFMSNINYGNRGLNIAHRTSKCWVDLFGPELDNRIRRFLKPTG